ncbi:MAG: hypothetical protein ACD_7C00505G0005 [uncultured bacterium]|nr:MAG: hypothetical protein ACD_7C00505G0005 [uncultured bacterium]HBR79559.1 hypothetical protein [Candidatus Moranbacteria bacterium]
MQNVTKIKIALVLGVCQFWLTSFVLYLNTKGISLEQTYFLLSFYSILIVVFEYPTGVIGDFFSHKASIIIGFLLYSFSLFLFSFSGSIYYYGLILTITALGASLVSGSDIALLHKASKNFKKDLSQVKFYSFIMAAVAISTGGFLSTLDLKYPLYASAFAFLLGSLFLIFSKNYKNERIAGNIFATATLGFRYAIANKELFNLIKISSLLGAFFISLKWFYNPLFIKLNIPLDYWGIIIAAAGILIAIGVWVFNKFPEKNITVIFFILILSIFSIGITSIVALPIVAIFLNQLLRGYIETQLDVKINKAIKKSIRASVLSLKNIIIKVESSAMIFFFGIIIQRNSFLVMMSIFAIGIFILGIYPILKIKKLQSKTI